MAFICNYAFAQLAFQIATERVPVESTITCSRDSTPFASYVKLSGNRPKYAAMLSETDDRHSIFGLQSLVTSGACVHQLTLPDQVLHFKFESDN